MHYCHKVRKMIKKLHLYFYSLRSSAFFKPITLIMLFISVAIAFLSCGWASRAIVSEMEKNLYDSLDANITREINLNEVADELHKLREDGLFKFNADAQAYTSFRSIEICANSKTEIADGMVNAIFLVMIFLVRSKLHHLIKLSI